MYLDIWPAPPFLEVPFLLIRNYCYKYSFIPINITSFLLMIKLISCISFVEIYRRSCSSNDNKFGRINFSCVFFPMGTAVVLFCLFLLEPQDLWSGSYHFTQIWSLLSNLHSQPQLPQNPMCLVNYDCFSTMPLQILDKSLYDVVWNLSWEIPSWEHPTREQISLLKLLDLDSSISDLNTVS